jgi:hypothetical protein
MYEKLLIRLIHVVIFFFVTAAKIGEIVVQLSSGLLWEYSLVGH